MNLYVEAEIFIVDSDGEPVTGEDLEATMDDLLEHLPLIATDGDVAAEMSTGKLTLCFYVEADSPARAFEQTDRIVETVTKAAGLEDEATRWGKLTATPQLVPA